MPVMTDTSTATPRKNARMGFAPVQNRVVVTMRSISNRLNRILATKYGRTLNFHLDCEYPKAGGTWFGKMASEVMQIPYPEHNIFPIGCACVLHNHWPWRKGLDHAWYLRRDGRDVMVSFYFHRMRDLQAGNPTVVRRFGQVYDQLFGAGYDPNDTRRNLGPFIEHEFKNPRDSPRNWRDHLMEWHDGGRGRPGVVYLSYEELVADTAGTLTSSIERLTGNRPDDWVVQQVVEKYSMARQTGGRKAGEEDRGSFIRKGVAGDWVNHFGPTAARRFNDLAGDALVAVGYEEDRDWVTRYDLQD